MSSNWSSAEELLVKNLLKETLKKSLITISNSQSTKTVLMTIFAEGVVVVVVVVVDDFVVVVVFVAAAAAAALAVCVSAFLLVHPPMN